MAQGQKGITNKTSVWWLLFQIVLGVPLPHDDEYSRSTITNIMPVGNVTNRINVTHVAHMEGTYFVKIVLMDNPLSLTTILFLMPHFVSITGLTEREVVEKSKGYIDIFISINITHVAHMEDTCFAKVVMMDIPLSLTIIMFLVPHSISIMGLTKKEAVEKAKGYIDIFILKFTPMKITISSHPKKYS